MARVEVRMSKGETTSGPRAPTIPGGHGRIIFSLKGTERVYRTLFVAWAGDRSGLSAG